MGHIHVVHHLLGTMAPNHCAMLVWGQRAALQAGALSPVSYAVLSHTAGLCPRVGSAGWEIEGVLLPVAHSQHCSFSLQWDGNTKPTAARDQP